MSAEKTEKFKEILKKALTFNLAPTEESFPELPEVLVWMRFFIAIFYGVFLGLKQVVSGTMPLQALNLICFVPVMYCRLYLGVSADTFNTEVIFSGTFNAVALCILIWIYYFTAEHSEDEAKMVTLLVSVAASQDDGTAAGLEGASGGDVVPPVVGEDSEF